MKQILPAIPLVTCDPYFSLWSCSNELTGSKTCHWTGAPKDFYGTVDIDGETFRFMGTGDAAPIEQTDVKITATASIFTFQNSKIKLTVTFRTPLLLSDLELISRPVSYISFEVESIDGNAHQVSATVSLDECHCYDGNKRKPMLGGIHKLDGFDAAFMGQTRQAPLSHSGDDVTIDWGYIFLAAPNPNAVYYNQNERTSISAAVALDVSSGANAKSFIAIGYDDIASISYFGDTLKGYWARDGKSILDVLAQSVNDYRTIVSRCKLFDESLVEIANSVGGKPYCEICLAAYRQSIAAHKLVADKDGNVLFISKECFSNGCAATVDVSYPSVPLYMLFQPELIKGMLRPIFKFAEMPVWEYDFAPHDAGRFPYVWGQVYALKANQDNLEVYPPVYTYPKGAAVYNDRYQMPVEECGNMLIMTAAVALVTKDSSFYAEHFDTLEKWANYLIEFGADPDEQLCTDDFAGHLAHNVNLAIKAIMGIQAFSMLMSLNGRANEAAQYGAKAAKLAAQLEKKSKVSDHTVLAYGDKDSFSLKYNLVWDSFFGSRLFSNEIIEGEINCYLKHMNKFGVPLDSRETYTKSDWNMWAAALAQDPSIVEEFAKPMADFLKNATTRTPFSDWYDTKTGKQIGFQNRTVQGGLFMPILLSVGELEQQLY